MAALARGRRPCYTGLGMPRDGDEEERLSRLRQTRYLVIGGAVCLLLPLAAALYLKLSDSGLPATDLDTDAIFARRDSQAQRLQPAGSAAAPGTPLAMPSPTPNPG